MNDFEILDKNIKEENINWLYGGASFVVTLKDINALLKGQKLYGTICDEYAFTIELSKDCSINNYEKKLADIKFYIEQSDIKDMLWGKEILKIIEREEK